MRWSFPTRALCSAILRLSIGAASSRGAGQLAKYGRVPRREILLKIEAVSGRMCYAFPLSVPPPPYRRGAEGEPRTCPGSLQCPILLLAMVDISFSNSLIEAWWRSLKHNWLFLHPLDSAATVRRQVAFYVEEHNGVVPHSAFKGQTPDEMYFGKGGDIHDQLAEARAEARARRMEKNRARQCAVCA